MRWFYGLTEDEILDLTVKQFNKYVTSAGEISKLVAGVPLSQSPAAKQDAVRRGILTPR